MKKLFAILAMICMVAIASPAMAIDMDEDGEQFQGGINIYLENAAFESVRLEHAFGAEGTIVWDDFNAEGGIGIIGEYGKIAGSADIVAVQASMQRQENDTDINFCNKEEVYMQEQDNYYSNGYDYDYFRGESPMDGTYELLGQNQTWMSGMEFDTSFGQVTMIQQGVQNGISARFTQTPQLDLNGIANQAEYFFDQKLVD
jgi:hypothetical protein